MIPEKSWFFHVYSGLPGHFFCTGYMRKLGMAEKYVRLVQDMYKGSETVVRCAVRTTERFKVKFGLHQGLALSPFLFDVIMDRITDEIRREPLWTMLFADDIVICEEIRKDVE